MFPVLFAVGVGVQILAAQRAEEQAARQAREQAHIADIQGTISLEQAKLDAAQALKQGQEESNFLQRESRRRVGAMAVQTATSGLELGGSPMEVMAEQIYRDEMGAATALTNATRKSAAITGRGMADKAGSEATASMLRDTAGFVERGAWLNSVAIGLSGAARYYYMTGGSAYSSPMSTYEFAGRSGYQGDYSYGP